MADRVLENRVGYRTHVSQKGLSLSLQSLSLLGFVSCSLASIAIASPIDLDADGVPETIALGASGALEIRAGVGGGVLRTLPPPLPNTGFGSTWLVTPNITGDTTPELLITSPSYPDAAGGILGSVSLFDPQTATLLWTVTGTASHPLTTSILTIGDQDFDGLSEFLVQANGAETRVLVVSSADGAVLATRDGSIGDISQLLASGVSVYSPADRDGNGLVDSADFKDFVDSYEAQAQSADINRDGVVDSVDLARFVNGFAEGSITIDAVTTGLASSSSGSGGSGGGTLNPPSNSIPGEQPDDWECGCPEAEPNPAECLPAEMTIVCPTIRDWPVNGGYIDVPWSVTLPPNATGLGVSCVSQCAGTNPQPQPSAIVVPGINRVTGTSSIFVQPNQRFVRICYSYQMQGTTEVCTVCASCVPECDLFELSLDIEIESPSFLIPGGTHHFNVFPENTVCDEWIWVVLEGAEWIAEPMFVPQPAPIPGLQPGQLVYIGGNSLEVEIAAADVPFGTSPVVRVAAMCVQTNSCYAAWDGAEGSSFVCDDSDDDLLADCEELAMADGGDCPDHNEPDSDEDGYDDGVEVLHGSNPCNRDSTPVGSRDSDMDGASDFEEEFFRRTNPDRFDQDQDGLQDYAEFLLGTDPRNPMSSGGIRDGALPIAVAADQDADGLIDQYEMERGWNAGNADQDEDGIRDGLEVRRRMNPNKPDQGPAAPGIQVDTDGDGLSNSVEGQLGTDAQRRDSDGDGVSDGNEARMGLDPSSARTHCRTCGPTDGEGDWDHDGITNATEDRLGLDPASADSDGDGKCDSQDLTDPSEQTCSPPDVCWTPNNPESSDCSGGACVVFRVPGCAAAGTSGSVYVNGEQYSLPTCGSGEELLVAVTPGSDFTIAYSCGTWATHGRPELGAACRNAAGEFDQSSYRPSAGNSSFAYDKEMNRDMTGCLTGASDGIEGSQFGSVPPFSPTEPLPGQNCATDCSILGPPKLDLWIDSNNDSGLAIKGVNSRDEEAEHDPDHPGKILFASTGDSDGDRIPNFADGFDRDDHGTNVEGTQTNSQHELDDTSDGARLVPIKIVLGGTIPTGTQIRFHYSAAKPTLVREANVDNGDPADALFMPGTTNLLRLWTAVPAPQPTRPPARGRIYNPGSSSGIVTGVPAPAQPAGNPCAEVEAAGEAGRSKLDVAMGGSFVDDNAPYSIESLNGGSISREIVLYVEAVRASTSIQEGTITAELILPPALQCMASSSDTSDTVRCTAIDRRIRPLDVSNGNLLPPVSEAPISVPVPKLNVSYFDPFGFEVEDDVARMHINLAGTLTDAMSDLIPGPSGTITSVRAIVNGDLLVAPSGGESVPLGLPTTIRTKATGAESTDTLAVKRLRPYQFEGDFNGTLSVPVQLGKNSIRLLASNWWGHTGFVEYTVEVSRTPAFSPDYVEFELDTSLLASSGIAHLRSRHGSSLAALTPWLDITLFESIDDPTILLGDGVTVELLDSPPANVAEIEFTTFVVTGVDVPTSNGTTLSSFIVQSSETFASSNVLSVVEVLDDTYHGELSYYTYSFEPNSIAVSSQSNGGVFKPFVFEMVGPDIVWDDGEDGDSAFVGSVSINDAIYHIDHAPDGWILGREILAEAEPQIRTSTFVATPTFTQPGLSEDDVRKIYDQLPVDVRLAALIEEYQTVEGQLAYIKGLGKGLLDSGISLVEGVWEIAKFAVRTGIGYQPIVIAIRKLRGGDIIMAEDKDTIRTGLALAETIGSLSLKVLTDEYDFAKAYFQDDYLELTQLGIEYIGYMNIAMPVLRAMRDELLTLKPEHAGWIVGRMTGELLLIIGPGLVTGGASAVGVAATRAATLTAWVERLRAPGVMLGIAKGGRTAAETAQLAAKFERLLLVLDDSIRICNEVSNAGWCFVAGTLVSTPTGLRPIECITPGELVWAGDPTTEKPNPRKVTLVSHSTARVTHDILWMDGSGRTGHMSCTAGHLIFSASTREFVPASRLAIGEELQGIEGHRLKVIANRRVNHLGSSGVPVFNLSVSDQPTYFVGTPPVLVHNSGVFCKKFGEFLLQEMHRTKELEGGLNVGRAFTKWVGILPPNARTEEDMLQLVRQAVDTIAINRNGQWTISPDLPPRWQTFVVDTTGDRNPRPREVFAAQRFEELFLAEGQVVVRPPASSKGDWMVAGTDEVWGVKGPFNDYGRARNPQDQLIGMKKSVTKALNPAHFADGYGEVFDLAGAPSELAEFTRARVHEFRMSFPEYASKVRIME